MRLADAQLDGDSGEILLDRMRAKPGFALFFTVRCYELDEDTGMRTCDYREFQVRVNPRDLKFMCLRALSNKSGKAVQGPLMVEPI